MSVLANSRYINSQILTVTAPPAFGGGDISVIVPSTQRAFSFSYVSHQVVAGDRADTLASVYYGDATMWWRIADANPQVMYWDDLTLGIVLRIPVLA